MKPAGPLTQAPRPGGRSSRSASRASTASPASSPDGMDITTWAASPSSAGMTGEAVAPGTTSPASPARSSSAVRSASSSPPSRSITRIAGTASEPVNSAMRSWTAVDSALAGRNEARSSVATSPIVPKLAPPAPNTAIQSTTSRAGSRARRRSGGRGTGSRVATSKLSRQERRNSSERFPRAQRGASASACSGDAGGGDGGAVHLPGDPSAVALLRKSDPASAGRRRPALLVRS